MTQETREFSKPRILPPVWLVIALLAMFIFDRWLPLQDWSSMTAVWTGVVFLVLGLCLLASAALGFNKAKTGIVPFSESTQLVTSGLYRFTRNPMYLGMVFILIGAALEFASVGAWIPIPVFVWVIQHQYIRNEEVFLTGIYGDEFRNYVNKVRRWL